MKQLEDKIMDRVYREETKSLGISFLLKTFLFAAGFFIAVLFIQIIVEFMIEGQILSLSEILSDDWTVITESMAGIIAVIFDEVPPPLFIVAGAGLFLCIIIVMTVILHFEKIKNRVRALVHHRKNRHLS